MQRAWKVSARSPMPGLKVFGCTDVHRGHVLPRRTPSVKPLGQRQPLHTAELALGIDDEGARAPGVRRQQLQEAQKACGGEEGGREERGEGRT